MSLIIKDKADGALLSTNAESESFPRRLTPCDRFKSIINNASNWTRSGIRTLCQPKIQKAIFFGALLSLATHLYSFSDSSSTKSDEYKETYSEIQNKWLCKSESFKDLDSLSQTDLSILENCLFDPTEIQDELMDRVQNELKKVARKMGAKNPDRFKAKLDISISGHNAGIDSLGVAYVGIEYPLAMVGLSKEVTRNQALGVLAHEVAHRILRHQEVAFASGLKLLGVNVESLEDVSELLKIASFKFRRTPTRTSAKVLLQDFKKLGPMETMECWSDKGRLESRFKQRARNLHTIDLSTRFYIVKLITQLNPIYDPVSHEREADLLTLRFLPYARGLREAFITDCTDPKQCIEPIPGHPTFLERITYLTASLCQKYPEQNKDICFEVCAAMPRQETNNQTCQIEEIA